MIRSIWSNAGHTTKFISPLLWSTVHLQCIILNLIGNGRLQTDRQTDTHTHSLYFYRCVLLICELKQHHCASFWRARILCGMRNVEWRQRVLCGILDAEKHAELCIICGIKNAEKSCFSLLTFANVSMAVLCMLFSCGQGVGLILVCPHPTPHFYSRSR